MFSQDDPWYTNRFGINNDECEYFGNGIRNNEKIFIQNYVFDTKFEIKFHFGEDLEHVIRQKVIVTERFKIP